MREQMLKKLKQWFLSDGLTTPGDDEEITDFDTEVAALSDEDLLELYEWTTGFQG